MDIVGLVDGFRNAETGHRFVMTNGLEEEGKVPEARTGVHSISPSPPILIRYYPPPSMSNFLIFHRIQIAKYTLYTLYIHLYFLLPS